jgi:hypothetical protein
MIPLGQAASNEMAVKVEFVYVCPAPHGWDRGAPHLEGPLFDLPLKDITWHLYLPEGYEYSDFEGALTADRATLERLHVERYVAGSYDERLKRQIETENRLAKSFLKKGSYYANQGEQMAAKQALENAYNFSLNQQDLNEDARVQLHKLNKQQAVVGMVGRRGRLRPGASRPVAQQAQQERQTFNQNEADRIESSLAKADSENLALIAERMIGQQKAAAGFAWPLKIDPAPRGRHIKLTGAIQVKPNSPMDVRFDLESKEPPRWGNLAAAAALFAALMVFGHIWHYLRRAADAPCTPAVAASEEGPE